MPLFRKLLSVPKAASTATKKKRILRLFGPFLYMWGGGNSGELGLGDDASRSSPTQVGSLTTWTEQVKVSGNFTAAVKTDGTLWTWGESPQGQLGLGNATQYKSPKQVGALTNWATISHSNSIAPTCIKTDGTIWGWGYNIYGQLGNNDTTNLSSPVQIGSDTNWVKAAGSSQHNMAIKSTGTLWVWGRGIHGQLGKDNTTNYSTPQQLGALTTWLSVAAGYYHSAAVKTDGTLWMWGQNTNGKLGLGDTTNRSSPVQVGGLTTWLQVACGGYNGLTCAVTSGGTLYCWGNNSSGQLGQGDTTNRSNPAQVGALTNWLKVAVNDSTVIATKTDGTLWAWGNNSGGQLGLGNRTNYSSPKQVGSLTNWKNPVAGGDSCSALHFILV